MLADEIGERVATIHPELDWELGKGLVARHGFTLSPAGKPELRAAAARWLALAHPPTTHGSSTTPARPSPRSAPEAADRRARP